MPQDYIFGWVVNEMKVAVTVLFPFIVIVVGFVVPEQVLKTGLAVLQDVGPSGRSPA